MRLLDLSKGVSMTMAEVFRAMSAMRVIRPGLFSISSSVLLAMSCFLWSPTDARAQLWETPRPPADVLFRVEHNGCPGAAMGDPSAASCDVCCSRRWYDRLGGSRAGSYFRLPFRRYTFCRESRAIARDPTEPAMDARFEGVVSRGKIPDITDRRCGHTLNRRPEDRVFVEVGKRAIQHAGRRDPFAGAKLDPADL